MLPYSNSGSIPDSLLCPRALLVCILLSQAIEYSSPHTHALLLLFLFLDISFYSSFRIRNQNKNKQPDENKTSNRTTASKV